MSYKQLFYEKLNIFAGLILFGISQMVVSTLYIPLNRFVSLSSMTVEMTASLGLAGITFGLLNSPGTGWNDLILLVKVNPIRLQLLDYLVEPSDHLHTVTYFCSNLK